MARRGDSAALGAVLDRHRVALFAQAVLRGQDELRRWCEQDLTDRVGYRLADVASGAGMTIVEAEFVNRSY